MASKINDDRLIVNQDRPFVKYLDDRPVVENTGRNGSGEVRGGDKLKFSGEFKQNTFNFRIG